jgi:hypothetical protein
VINKNLVLLSYGNVSEYLRAVYCLLSLSAWLEEDAANPGIVIYTDNPGFFQTYLGDLQIEYFFLSPRQILEMQAGTNFIHRIKVAVIDLTFKRFPDQEVIFIDSDTFFTADPMELFNGLNSSTSFMHKREYNFKDGLELYNSFKQEMYPKAFIDYISGREFYIDGKAEIFDINDYSWNSGVLGLHKDFGIYMPDVMRLTDEFYANSKWFISEQLAFSLILQRRTKIRSAENFIFHYWGKRQKILVDVLLEKLFEEHAADLTKKVFMKSVTRKWKNIIEADLIYEQAKNAFLRRDFLYASKKAFHFFLKKLFIL